MTKSMVVEDGVVAGNVTDKYGSRNPLYHYLMNGFCRAAQELVDATSVSHLHEVGCGEGHLTRLLDRPGRVIRASDFSEQIIATARELTGVTRGTIDYRVRSIYDLNDKEDVAELIVCCEVLEHLDDPEKALKVLAGLAQPYLLASVPREPIWRVLNVMRGKYLSDLGNTPGHLNHWSSSGFVRFLQRHFDIVEARRPFPWTMVLCKART